MLARYHLPEMPEEWNQLAFDDHVYDANTLGRKSPTHLIMDAWIKGLRSLTVAYEYWVQPEAAREDFARGGNYGHCRAHRPGISCALLWPLHQSVLDTARLQFQ